MALQVFFRIRHVNRSLDVRLNEFIIILKHIPTFQRNWSRCGVLVPNFFQYFYKVLPKFNFMILVKLNLTGLHSTSTAKTLRSKSCRRKPGQWHDSGIWPLIALN